MGRGQDGVPPGLLRRRTNRLPGVTPGSPCSPSVSGPGVAWLCRVSCFARWVSTAVFALWGTILGAVIGLVAGLIRRARPDSFVRTADRGGASADPVVPWEAESGPVARRWLRGRVEGSGCGSSAASSGPVLASSFAVGFAAGAYAGKVVDRRLTEAIAAADRDDPYWRLDDLMDSREQVPDEENSALVVAEALSQLPENWPGTPIPQGGKSSSPTEAAKAYQRLGETAGQREVG